MNHKELLSLQEASKLVGLSRQYLWMLVQMNRLPAIRIGKLYVVTRPDIEEYQKSRQTQVSQD